jgi:hypothetical protein
MLRRSHIRGLPFGFVAFGDAREPYSRDAMALALLKARVDEDFLLRLIKSLRATALPLPCPRSNRVRG